MKQVQSAILITDVGYPKDGKIITVKAETKILVDIVMGIALIGQDHVDVDRDEYILLA